MVIVSSGAALQGSPLSGGYAGAKRMQWFLSNYAATAAKRSGIALRVHCLLPTLNSQHRARSRGGRRLCGDDGKEPRGFEKWLQPALTPAIMGEAVASLFQHPERYPELAYQVGGQGLVSLSELSESAASGLTSAVGEKP